MKRIIINIMIIGMFIWIGTVGAFAMDDAAIYFSDVSYDDWYAGYMSSLHEKGQVSGYADGTFRPDRVITKAEFITLLLRSSGYNEEAAGNGHRNMNYIKKAEMLKIIEKDEIKEQELGEPINRMEVAKAIVNILNESYPETIDGYKEHIGDFSDIAEEYQQYVLKAYAKGLIAGYPDGIFNGNNNLTRAEALAVIMRVIDQSERISANKVKEGNDKYEAEEISQETPQDTSIQKSIVETAKKYLGVPYVWGGASPSGFDSSGIVWYTFKENNIKLPRVSFDMYKVGEPVSKEELLPGDIVFFEGYAPGPSHAVVFIGDGKFVHSPSTGKTVSIGNIDDPYYYGPRYYGARRIIQ